MIGKRSAVVSATYTASISALGLEGRNVRWPHRRQNGTDRPTVGRTPDPLLYAFIYGQSRALRLREQEAHDPE